MVFTGEVQQRDADGVWRTVRLGGVTVNDRRRAVDPLGLSPEQRARSERSARFEATVGRVMFGGRDVTDYFTDVTFP